MSEISKSPAIAVVVPVYNSADHLTACLQSLAEQTFTDFVCLLVDDGSRDGSGDLCEDFAARDERFTVLHQPNAGVSAARAAGVRAGQALGAAWFAFCDADDLCHPDFLRALHGAAQATGQALACCRYDIFTDTVPDEKPAPDPEKAGVLADPMHKESLLHALEVDYSLCNKLYAASLMDPAALENGYHYNEDLLANWLLFDKAEGCAYLDFCGYHYRQHALSASHPEAITRSLEEQKEVAVYIRDHAAPNVQQSVDSFYYEKLAYLSSMILRRKDIEPYRDQLMALRVELRAGLRDERYFRNPKLSISMRIAALATVYCPGGWRLLCRLLLRDRQ